jgi:Amt family ammonium transporter
MLIESVQHGKTTSLGIASGILAGLVAITPAAGVVQPLGAIALGAVASLICYTVILTKSRLGYDDSLDVFGIHGVAGITGALLLSFFIRPSWMAKAAAVAGGSWTAWQQLGIQASAVAITLVYCATVTLVLAILVEKTFGFRLDQAAEMAGMDQSLHAEHGYGLLNLD